MKINRLLSFISILFLVIVSAPVLPIQASGPIHNSPSSKQLDDLLLRMTPEERVGQLFLVTFNGATVNENSPIYDLIAHHYVGGVVLTAANDNFEAAPNTLLSAYQLIAQLQTIAWQSSQESAVDPKTGEQASPNYIPLLIGISQDGDGYPNDQILSGVTSLPDPMAIGATWDPSLAQQVGSLAGRELSSLGFNVYFGPPLDVLESPESTLGNGLGADVFGGDPYWVGVMGQAYVDGLHAGSHGRMIVIAKHFPGRGSSDRPAGEEPATVRKSLEQLKQIELAPFFAVTGNAQNVESVVDGLIVSHIRYQGFQGNIRSTTRPVSFDSQALSQILSLPPFLTWRQNGGLMVSDDLGSQTVRRFYDPGGHSFLARLVARDAFLAGNDLLNLGNIQSSDAPDSYNSVLNILDFFVQKYIEDPAFAKRVDEAVVRILAVKTRLYGTFDLSEVIPSADGIDLIGQSQEVPFETARQAATLISPDVVDLASVLPSPPGARDRLVFFTDTRLAKQCSTCPEDPMLSIDALQNAVLRLYGPLASGQMSSSRLVSYSFADMAAILKGGMGNQDVVDSLRQAGWVIVNILDMEPGQTQTTTLRRFLSERQDLLSDKRVILFAFNAPYYLDSTDISKLTAYYCLYSKSAPFVDVAARLLFQELTPSGSSPVSIPGIGYDLFSATEPDPGQVIELALDLPAVPATPVSGTPEPTATPSFRVGDMVSVRSGVILDHNQHPVPDGTGVRFILLSSGEGGTIQEIDAATTQGIARASFSIPRAGLLEIRATSDPAITSVVLQLNISNEGISVTVVSPTLAVEPTPTPRTTVPPGANKPSLLGERSLGIVVWLGLIVVLGGMGYGSYLLGERLRSARWAVRWAICSILGGLLAYDYLAMRFPGTKLILQNMGYYGILGVVVIGGGIGLGIGLAWSRLVNGSMRQSD